MPRIGNLVVDGLTIIEDGIGAAGADYVQIYQPIDRLVLRDVTILRRNAGTPSGHLVTVPGEQGRVDQLVLNDVSASGFDRLVADGEKIGEVTAVNVVSRR